MARGRSGLRPAPLKNNLLELWSLVHMVDRASIALGELHQFSELFVTNDGCGIEEGTEEELRRRAVVCRTLRSNAQKFLRTPFPARHCQTINFHMGATEREFYNAVGAWLEGPMAAYRPNRRRMMGLNLRKRMGSSVQALASTFSNLREKLQLWVRARAGAARGAHSPAT